MGNGERYAVVLMSLRVARGAAPLPDAHAQSRLKARLEAAITRHSYGGHCTLGTVYVDPSDGLVRATVRVRFSASTSPFGLVPLLCALPVAARSEFGGEVVITRFECFCCGRCGQPMLLGDDLPPVCMHHHTQQCASCGADMRPAGSSLGCEACGGMQVRPYRDDEEVARGLLADRLAV